MIAEGQGERRSGNHAAGIDKAWAMEVMVFRDVELDPERAARMGEHILQCAPCQALARDLGRVGNALRTAVDEETAQITTARVWPRVRASLRPAVEKEQPKGWLERLFPGSIPRWAFVIPAVLLVFLGAILYDFSRRTPMPEGSVIIGRVESPVPVFLYQERESQVAVIWVFESLPAESLPAPQGEGARAT